MASVTLPWLLARLTMRTIDTNVYSHGRGQNAPDLEFSAHQCGSHQLAARAASGDPKLPPTILLDFVFSIPFRSARGVAPIKRGLLDGQFSYLALKLI
jgi:hypothetical protein